jgi:hypothetical protein
MSKKIVWNNAWTRVDKVNFALSFFIILIMHFFVSLLYTHFYLCEIIKTTCDQGCHNGRFWMKTTIRTSFPSGRPRMSSGRPPASAFTPWTWFYPRTGFTVHRRGKNPSAQTRPNVRANMGRPRGRTHSLPPLSSPSPLQCGRSLLSTRTREKKIKIKIKIKIISFGSCCRLGKREIFGFRFSIPKIPELRGLRGLSREKKKVFSA